MRILIAEDSQTQAVDLRRRLEAMGHEVVVTANGLEAWNQLRKRPERLVISDWMMPEMSGLELCRKIRSEIKSAYIYVILLTAKTHRHERLQGLSAGADDFLAKPIDNCELEIALKTAQRIITAQEALVARARELEKANENLIRLAARDELTGLNNQRGFQESLATAVRQAVDDQLPLSLVRLDLDHPDRLMEQFSPSAWHTLLVKLADLLRGESRECDIPARLSEHGFALILPGLTSDWALPVADNVRDAVTERIGTDCRVTASLGVATMSPEGSMATAAQLLEACESALALARTSGGDRAVAAEDAAMV
jgi:two-component system cell cycle response regulator